MPSAVVAIISWMLALGNRAHLCPKPADHQGMNMLILTRRIGETLMIGDEVTVTVLGVKGNQVRLGVNAPKDVAVHREEIYDKINQQNGAHANDNEPDD